MESLDPLGRPICVFGGSRVLLICQVSFAQVRPLQISRTAFALTPKIFATFAAGIDEDWNILTASFVVSLALFRGHDLLISRMGKGSNGEIKHFQARRRRNTVGNQNLVRDIRYVPENLFHIPKLFNAPKTWASLRVGQRQLLGKGALRYTRYRYFFIPDTGINTGIRAQWRYYRYL